MVIIYLLYTAVLDNIYSKVAGCLEMFNNKMDPRFLEMLDKQAEFRMCYSNTASIVLVLIRLTHVAFENISSDFIVQYGI